MDEEFTGKTLIDAGYTPAPWFSTALREVSTQGLSGHDALRLAQEVRDAWVLAQPKVVDLQDPIPFHINITAENEIEAANMDMVVDGFAELTRTPTVIAGAIMPDACQAGPRGTIPVGGVIGAKGAIHPGMHSADICCSMFVTVLDGVDPGQVMDAAADVTHFGRGGRRDGRFELDTGLAARFQENPFLKGDLIMNAAHTQLGTQGDGNHFFYIGLTGEGKVAMVTHHGSRGVGGMLYKHGMRVADAHRQKVSPDTLKANAWIPSDSREGEDYWAALQLLRDWTHENHRVLHDAVADNLNARIERRLWNEHNFVFREDDVFWHAKGATPIHDGFLPDSDGVQIVPMNMAQPILLITGERTENNLGFAPHGAGRNMSRTAHKNLKEGKSDLEIFQEETAHIDARFHSSNIDVSELPSAYKNADSVQRDMERFNLCRVAERIEPYGSIMGGDMEIDAPWKKKQAAKRAEKLEQKELDTPGF